MGTGVEQVTTATSQNLGPYGGVISNSIYWLYGNRATNFSKNAVAVESTFARNYGRRPEAKADVERWIEDIKELSKGRNAFVFGPRLERVMQLLAEAESHGVPWECSPSLLSRVFLTWVVADLESLERIVEKLTGLSLSFQQQTALFRELCLFYDGLWYLILLADRIIKTGRIPVKSIEAYRELVRKKGMELIATSEYLPEQWRNWGAKGLPTDLQTDFDFYMQEKVPSSRQEKFDVILGFTQTRDQGPVLKRLAWLHMRTREIFGLGKLDPMIDMILWNSQANFTCEMIEKNMSNILPIPK